MPASARFAHLNDHGCRLIAVLLCITHWVMAVTAALTKSPTFDEPTHFASGYSYWLRDDYRLDPEAGILPLRWATLPLFFSHPTFPPADSAAWQARDAGRAGVEFLYRLGNDADALLLCGRMMMAALSALLCGVVYVCSRSIFGRPAGLISVTAAAFSPTLLGHGALVTADVTAALFFLLATWSLWKMLHRFSASTVLGSSAAVAAVLLSKMSGLLIVPIAGFMLLLRVIAAVRRGERIVPLISKALGGYAISALAMIAAILACLRPALRSRPWHFSNSRFRLGRSASRTHYSQPRHLDS